MILKMEIDLDDLMNSWSGQSLDDLVRDQIRTAILSSPYFKAAVKAKAHAAVDKMTKEMEV